MLRAAELQRHPAPGRASPAAGLLAGDLLRRGARTDAETLPRPRRLSATEALQLAPPLRPAGLRGGLLSWDGQLEDDARLVTTVARTAAAYGAHVRTRARVLSATGTSVELRDELTGETTTVRARAVVNAAGVWAGDAGRRGHAAAQPRHPPGAARRTACPGCRSRCSRPVPGRDQPVRAGAPPARRHRLRRPHRRAGRRRRSPTCPSRPSPRSASCSTWSRPRSPASCTASDVVGAFAGLRPLLDRRRTAPTADLSRRHAVLTSRTGVVTIVGGKLTTYRRMAEDAVDAAVAQRRAAAPGRAGPAACRCSAPRPRPVLAALEQPARLVRRYGTDAELVLATAREVSGLADDELLAPVADGVPVDPGRAALRRHPRGRRRRRRPARPAYPRRAGPRRPRGSPVPAAERALELVRRPVSRHR